MPQYVRVLTFILFLWHLNGVSAKDIPELTIPTGVSGHWEGTIDDVVRVGFQLDIEVDHGRLSGKILVPSWGSTRWCITHVAVAGKRLTFTIYNDLLAEPALFDVTLEGERFAGEYRWAGESYVLRGGRSEIGIARQTPSMQVPCAPFPYRSQDVSFKRGGLQIAGVLTIPIGVAPVPAVLINPSGRKWYASVVIPGRPMPGATSWIVADALARAGIATFRYSSRGCDGSGGDIESTTFDELTEDAAAALQYLCATPGVDNRRIGVLGVMQGSRTSIALAARQPEISLVCIGASGLSGRDAYMALAQKLAITPVRGSPTDVATDVELRREIVDHLRSNATAAQVALEMQRRYEESPTWQARISNPLFASLVAQLSTPYMRSLLNDDPAHFLRMCSGPVLSLHGESDLVMDSLASSRAIRAALTLANNHNATIVVLKRHGGGLNICDNESKPTPGQTIDPLVLKMITDWLGKQFQ